MNVVTVATSTDRSEEYMLLFSRNTLLILMKKMETVNPFNEERNLASNVIYMKSYLLPITNIYIYIYMHQCYMHQVTRMRPAQADTLAPRPLAGLQCLILLLATVL